MFQRQTLENRILHNKSRVYRTKSVVAMEAR